MAVFKAIPAGVFIPMGRLTLITNENKGMSITSLYPTHADALWKANLLYKKIPTIHELYAQELEQKEKQKSKDAEKKRRKDEQRIYFVIGHAHFCAKFNIAGIMKHLAKKCNLTYLCFSTAYRRFTNLQEKFQGDIVAKVNEEVESLDFIDCPCNCRKHCFVN
eukprot:13637317-Ditylum_brightwellii.AAC.1